MVQADTERVRQEYDRLATSYDRRWRNYVDRTQVAVVEGLSLQGTERLLDLACGTGELERKLLARWPHLRVVGVDGSRGMLEQAKKKVFGPQVSWVQADAAALPFPDGWFDVAVCANSFHYFPSPEKALGEVRRIVRPGGSFLLVDWCDDFLSCKLCGLGLKWTDRAFRKMYTQRECRPLLQQCGFEVIRSDAFRVQWLWGLMRFMCRRSS